LPGASVKLEQQSRRVKRFVWSQTADADFDAAFETAVALGGDQAARLLDLIEEAEQLIGTHPQAGGQLEHSQYRKWRLRELPYALLYQVELEAIFIIRLIHLRSDWQALP
jgi:toxin ParE1/3/4